MSEKLEKEKGSSHKYELHWKGENFKSGKENSQFYQKNVEYSTIRPLWRVLLEVNTDQPQDKIVEKSEDPIEAPEISQKSPDSKIKIIWLMLRGKLAFVCPDKKFGEFIGLSEQEYFR